LLAVSFMDSKMANRIHAEINGANAAIWAAV